MLVVSDEAGTVKKLHLEFSGGIQNFFWAVFEKKAFEDFLALEEFKVGLFFFFGLDGPPPTDGW